MSKDSGIKSFSSKTSVHSRYQLRRVLDILYLRSVPPSDHSACNCRLCKPVNDAFPVSKEHGRLAIFNPLFLPFNVACSVMARFSFDEKLIRETVLGYSMRIYGLNHCPVENNLLSAVLRFMKQYFNLQPSLEMCILGIEDNDDNWNVVGVVFTNMSSMQKVMNSRSVLNCTRCRVTPNSDLSWIVKNIERRKMSKDSGIESISSSTSVHSNYLRESCIVENSERRKMSKDSGSKSISSSTSVHSNYLRESYILDPDTETFEDYYEDLCWRMRYLPKKSRKAYPNYKPTSNRKLRLIFRAIADERWLSPEAISYVVQRYQLRRALNILYWRSVPPSEHSANNCRRRKPVNEAFPVSKEQRRPDIFNPLFLPFNVACSVMARFNFDEKLELIRETVLGYSMRIYGLTHCPDENLFLAVLGFMKQYFNLQPSLELCIRGIEDEDDNWNVVGVVFTSMSSMQKVLNRRSVLKYTRCRVTPNSDLSWIVENIKNG